MSIVRRLRLYGELVMFSHSIFSFAFLVIAAFSAARGWPSLRDGVLLSLAFLGARTCANALNRVIDRKSDAANPRTASRHIPKGRVSVIEAIIIAVISYIVLSVAAFTLCPLCALFLPLIGMLFVLYSYSKRFTWLCHWLLGLSCAGAPFGAWLALRGGLHWPIFVLVIANAFWVAGFDIIYAIRDIDFDLSYGLYSFPSRFGKNASLGTAAFCHCVALASLFTFGYGTRQGYGFVAALLIAAGILTLAIILSAKNYQKYGDFSAYLANKLVSLTLLAGTLFDRIVVDARSVW